MSRQDGVTKWVLSREEFAAMWNGRNKLLLAPPDTADNYKVGDVLVVESADPTEQRRMLKTINHITVTTYAIGLSLSGPRIGTWSSRQRYYEASGQRWFGRNY